MKTLNEIVHLVRRERRGNYFEDWIRRGNDWHMMQSSEDQSSDPIYSALSNDLFPHYCELFDEVERV